MSIYESEKKLSEYVYINQPYTNEIIAEYNRGEILKLRDIDKLESIVSKYPDTKIKFKYWNYNFCNKLNINESEIDRYIKNTTEVIFDKHDYFLGSIISVVYFYDIMYNCYNLTESDFDIYFNKIIIDLNIIRDNFIVSTFVFPINNNVIFLLKKLFTNDDIYRILKRYNIDDIQIIYNHFEINDIHLATKFLMHVEDSEDKYNIIDFMVKKYDNTIDKEKEVTITNSTFHLGFYFLTLEENYNYYKVYETLVNYNCSFDFKFEGIDNDIINKVKNRLTLINETLVKWK